MPYTTIKTLVKSMGFCCIFAFISAMRGSTKPKIAERLGVHKDTIAYWKRKVKRGKCKCEKAGGCVLRLESKVPRVEVKSLRSGRSDPFV